MANSTTEKGYTKIENKLLDTLIRLIPGSTETQILLAVIRKTNGWGKPEDSISVNQFVGLTNKSRRMVIYAIQNLEAKRMLNVKRNKGRGHINEINKISLNKNHTEWVVQEKSPQYCKALKDRKLRYEKSKIEVVQEKEGSARTCKKVVQDVCTHKRKITKESNSIYTIFAHWCTQKIIIHKDIVKYNDIVGAKLNIYKLNEILDAISNYAQIIRSREHYFTHKWTLAQFLQRGLDRFLTSSDPFNNFKIKGGQSGEYSKNKSSNRFTGLDKKNYNEGVW